MGMIGSAVGAAASIAGGIASAATMKKVKQNIEEQQRKNEDWYNRRYNEDSTQRADAQSILNATLQSIKDRNAQAAGAQAVMGGTDESVAAEKAANNKALSDATAQIAAAGDQRKDAIESQYQARDAQLANQMNDYYKNQAQNIQQATSAMASAAGSMPF